MSTISMLVPSGLSEVRLPYSGALAPDANRLVDVDVRDYNDAQDAGLVQPGLGKWDRRIIGKKIIDLTVLGDTAVEIDDASLYIVQGFYFCEPSGSPVVSAKVGLYSVASPGTDATVASPQALTALSAAHYVSDLTVYATTKQALSASTLYVRVTAADVSPTSATVVIVADVLS